MLTEEQQRRRQGRVTASFVPYLMAGNEPKILNEWMRLVDHPDYEEEDLSDNWPVQFGSFVETFALDWHARRTGQPLVHRGEFLAHPELPHVGCTLDAYRREDRSVIDCKAPTKWRKLEDVLAYYPGQLVVQKACWKAQRAALLIVHGGDEPVEHELTWDPPYEKEVWTRIKWFWERVESLQVPCAIPAAQPAEPSVRIVDMTGNNEWGSFAATWLTHKDGAKLFNEAAKGLKGLIEADVAKAHGHGVVCSRSRAGALTIKEQQKL